MTIDEFEKKLTELEDLHNELKAQIAELKAQGERKPKPPHPRWKPEEGEYYYWFTGQGTPSQDKWVASACDRDLYNIGNVFFDLKTATFAAERLKVLAEMREWAGNWNDQYTIYVNPCDGTNLHVSDRLLWTNGEMRFATCEDAEGCIKAVGEDRIKKYYFMIPEDEADDD